MPRFKRGSQFLRSFFRPPDSCRFLLYYRKVKNAFSLRPAVEADADAIRDLVHSARLNPMGLEWRRFVVAVSPDGGVVGCVQLKPHRDGSWELASLVVRPDWRGKGVARALIERILALRPGELYLMCRSKLGSLYARFGFRPIEGEELPAYFRRISRLASVFGMLSQEGEKLLVMKRD